MHFSARDGSGGSLLKVAWKGQIDEPICDELEEPERRLDYHRADQSDRQSRTEHRIALHRAESEEQILDERCDCIYPEILYIFEFHISLSLYTIEFNVF